MRGKRGREVGHGEEGERKGKKRVAIKETTKGNERKGKQ